jgi:hypothetical protein
MMIDNQARQGDKDQEESGPADEGPDFGQGPESPEPGHPVGETQPTEGMPPRAYEEPQDIPPPRRQEDDEAQRTEPAGGQQDPESA